jgi:hypothetical protein
MISRSQMPRELYNKGSMPSRNKKNFRPTKKGAGMTEAGAYCARSLGQLKRSSAKTRNDPNSRIRQARRRWKC